VTDVHEITQVLLGALNILFDEIFIVEINASFRILDHGC
jgi:hypothetical protein